jgi:hypothetical protein
LDSNVKKDIFLDFVKLDFFFQIELGISPSFVHSHPSVLKLKNNIK